MKKKFIIKTLILLITILMIGVKTVQADSSTYTFGINSVREYNGTNYIYAYATNNGLRYVWNVQRYENNIVADNKTYYCLAEGYGDFGEFNSSLNAGDVGAKKGGTSTSAYAGPYNLKEENGQNIFKITYPNSNSKVQFSLVKDGEITQEVLSKLLWVLDNMYIPEEDDEKQSGLKSFLSNIPCDLNGDENDNVYNVMTGNGLDEQAYLTVEDIKVIQQLVIWYFTNNEQYGATNSTVTGFPTIYLAKTDEEGNFGKVRTYAQTFDSIYSGTKTYGLLREYFAKYVFNYLVNGAKSTTDYQGDSATTVNVYLNEAAQPIVTITREKEITGSYNVVLKKVDNNNNALSNVTFTVNGKTYTTGKDGTVQITDGDVNINKENYTTTDTYSIVETSTLEGYTKYTGTITASVTKKISDDGLSYILNTIGLDSTSKNSGMVTISKDDTTQTITITVKNNQITGNYSVKITKTDANGAHLQGAVFTINGKEYTTNSDGNIILVNNQKLTIDNIGTEKYVLTEITAPTGYKLYEGSIELTVTTGLLTDGTYGVTTESLVEKDTNGNEKNSGNVKLDQETNTVILTIIEEQIEGNYSVKITKTDANGAHLQGAVFTINGKEYTTNSDGNIILVNNQKLTIDNIGTEKYVLTEITAPTGYKLYEGSIELTVTTGLLTDGTYGVITESLVEKDTNGNEKNSGNVKLDQETNTVILTIIEEKITGKYTVKINKQNEDGEVLQDAVFKVNGNELPATDKDGYVTIVEDKEINKDNLSTVDTYKISEITAPEGYIVYNGEITVSVTKKQSGEEYVLDNATYTETVESGNVKIKIEGNTVTVIIVEEKVEGKYTVKINKQNQAGKPLQNAIFNVNGKEIEATDGYGYATIVGNKEINEDNVSTVDTYKISEIKAPTGYVVYDGEITLTITKKQDGKKYTLDNATIDETSNASGKITISIDKSTNTVTVIVIEDNIDLALRKFITAVNNTELINSDGTYTRAPKVDTTNLKNGTSTTATYNHTKVPVQVEVNDKVTYTLRVYNEGQTDAYITEVTDYLSTYLEEISNTSEWTMTNGETGDTYSTKATTTKYAIIRGASEDVIKLNNITVGTTTIGENGILLPAYNGGDTLSYVDFQITCTVKEPKTASASDAQYKITNIAEITGMKDKDGNIIDEDADSTDDNVNLPSDENGWKDYQGDKIGKEDYIPGQEDDDDFEKVVIVVPKYDLALRKFIVAVNENELKDSKGNYTRQPIVDTTSLKQGIEENSYGTATYNHSKEPVKVHRNDIVTYVIRVYNEGNVNAYVSEITDNLPEYLEFIEDDQLNKAYGWSYDKNTRVISTKITAKDSEDPTGIYADRINGKMLLAYDQSVDSLDYIDVKIRCKVSNKAIADEKQTNIAEITDMTDTNGNNVEDVDSTPDGNLEIPDDENLPNYKDDETGDYIPGQEDDDDFDKVLVEGDFDLALRKFITKVNNTSVNNRYPNLSIDEDGNIKYAHTKNPVEVAYQDTVIYTIRIYNEGEIAGYANEITDDVPEGLEFIVDNDINKTYRWKMLDENQEETTDVSKAKYLVTDYLSEEQEKATGRNNLLSAYNKEEGLTDSNPDYRDVQIAFKVTYKITSKDDDDRVLVNIAQISADSDDDVDSTPNRDEVYNDEDHEDDIDYEQVKVKYFDLSLLKWVSKTLVTENGKTTETETGHTGYENPEPVVKVEIKSKDVNSVTVKFVYTIRITNEGEIAGYADEITDYIPEGLKFIQEDNPEWYERAEGVVGTDILKDRLLEPGESADVQITLTWINGEKNLGTKINIAEISKDSDDDIDSTPDNQVEGEDDIDDAPVMLVIKTGIGIEPKYTILGTIVTSILGIGIFAIKKFILI
jgi:uncharacterized repeat protein (TIGR01451 family)